MALTDFLGGVSDPQAIIPRMYGNGQAGPVMAAQPQMLGAPPMGQMAPPEMAQPSQPGRRKGVKHFLGVLGDALLTGAGGEPIYGPSVERAEMGEALANYVGNTDAALADIMRRDPATGFALLKMKQASAPEAQRPTALQQNIEYLRTLNPGMTTEQLAEVAQYAIAAPRMYGSPEMGWQPDPNYPFGGGSEQQAPEGPEAGVPDVSDEASYAAVPPGSQYRDPEGNLRTKPGGAASNGSGGFPQ